jgi:glycosyltransferase involved in cell wall biosynthesis
MLKSIVVPVYNSKKFLVNLLEAIETERVKNNWELELILIDDGSKDNSYDEIVRLSAQYSYIKGIKLSRNFGHQAAVRTGLQFCKGDYIAVIDDDLQDPPNLLPDFFSYLDKGFDVAYGVRTKRKESAIKKMSYNLFYKILKALSSIDMPLDSGDFCVMKRVVVEKMLLLNEKDPFLRGIRTWVGFKQIGVVYERHERFDGESGYTFKKLLKIASDGIFSFSSLPIRVISFLGVLGLTIAAGYSVYMLTKYFLFGTEAKGFTPIILFVSFFGSLNLICLGIIGEYIARIYSESKNRPHAIIEKAVNITDPV